MADRIDCNSHYYFKLTAGTLVLTVGFLLTGSIIAVLVRKSHLSAPNLLIFHLTLADFLGLVTVGPFFLTSLIKSSLTQNSAFCQTSAFFGRFSNALSIYMITLTGIARCHSIIRPLDHRSNFFNSRINRISAGLWCFSIIISFTPFFGWGEYELIEDQCWCQLNSNKYPYNWFVYFALVFVIPFVLNTGGYALTLRRVILRKRERKALRQSRRKSNGKRKVFVMESNRDISRDTAKTSSASMTPPDTINSCPENERATKNEQSHYNIKVDVIVKSEQDMASCGATNRDENAIKYSIPTLVQDIVNPSCQENKIAAKNERFHYNIKVNVELTEIISCENHKHQEDKANEEEIGIRNVCVSESGSSNSLPECISDKGDLPKNTNFQRSSLDRRASCAEPQRLQNKTENRITLIVTSLFLVYVLCSGQFFIVWTWFSVEPKSIPRRVFVVCRFLLGLNPLLNALLYGFISKEIRSGVISLWKEIFQRCQCKNDENDSVSD